MIAQACGGLMSITGEEDGPPCKPGATIGDTGTGMVMAVSILGAYVRRLRTGQGEHLQVAMQDSILHYIRNAFAYMERTDMQAGAARGLARRSAAAIRRSASIRPRAADANDYVYIFTSPANPEHWTRLLKVMGREELIGDKRYDTPAARTERRAEVDEIVGDLDAHSTTSTQPRAWSAAPRSRPAPCSIRASSPTTRASRRARSARPCSTRRSATTS